MQSDYRHGCSGGVEAGPASIAEMIRSCKSVMMGSCFRHGLYSIRPNNARSEKLQYLNDQPTPIGFVRRIITVCRTRP